MCQYMSNASHTECLRYARSMPGIPELKAGANASEALVEVDVLCVGEQARDARLKLGLQLIDRHPCLLREDGAAQRGRKHQHYPCGRISQTC